ncbi:MAG TPA: NADH:flavin oxidoreductase/NADH oxidase [Vitreimonas sp.]|nr:NADH:flavin oxidoreductase/NADH oxidase [Vitreimonas sp.]
MSLPKLFEPLQLGGITLPNRIAVSPMCQYSADDGSMTDWHLAHLVSMACSGAGLIMVEASGVTREGRISHSCTGLYSDHNEMAMKRVLDACRPLTRAPFGVQLAHAGRKGSAQVPWLGGKALGPAESPWPTVAPSAIAYADGWHVPHELSVSDLVGLKESFAKAAARALSAGFDLIELHAAHGYLMHQFLSPLANKRTDAYGAERMKFPLEVARALRDAWPKDRALGARISGSDWAEGGFEIGEAVVFARELKKIGFDYACVSSAALMPQQKMKVEPGYNTPFAARIRRESGITTRVGGMIADPVQAEKVLQSGAADQICLARALLDNPRWVWHAAERFGVKIDYPPQYARVHPSLWPGAKIARPEGATAGVPA